MFTARTTWVSNPICAPSLHPSLSELLSRRAFAGVSPLEINVFYHYLECTHRVPQSQALQYPLQSLPLRDRISQQTYRTSYGCFRPNNCGCDSDRRDYRGGWHRSCPVLIRLSFWNRQKFFKILKNTLARFLTLARIGKFPYLLHPVGLGVVSQTPS